MPAHDWRRVEAGIFHDFHLAWAAELRRALNEGLLPQGYYVLVEQHAGRSIPDVLTLHSSPEPLEPDWLPPDTGGIALAQAPPRVQRRQTVEQTLAGPTPLIGDPPRQWPPSHRPDRDHLTGESRTGPGTSMSWPTRPLRPSNAVSTCCCLDMFPPGPHDPSGIHGSLLQALQPSPEPYVLPANAPLTLASYVAGPQVDIDIEHFAVGSPLPEMPLFLRPDRYVNVPLEPTYQAAYRGTPAVWARSSNPAALSGAGSSCDRCVPLVPIGQVLPHRGE